MQTDDPIVPLLHRGKKAFSLGLHYKQIHGIRVAAQGGFVVHQYQTALAVATVTEGAKSIRTDILKGLVWWKTILLWDGLE